MLHELSFIIMVLCLLSYLVGSLPFGLWVGLLWKGVDIRVLGSKNIGATNVLRVLGPGPAFTVFLLDTIKGAVGILLAVHLLPLVLPEVAKVPFPFVMVIGMCAVLGHTFSPFLRFNGGKGVATTLGMVLALSPLVALCGLGVWLLALGLSRYVSLASILAAISLPIFSYLLQHDGRWWLVGFCTLLMLLVVIKHHSNIQRLLNGTEPKIGQRVKAPAVDAPPDPAPREEELSITR